LSPIPVGNKPGAQVEIVRRVRRYPATTGRRGSKANCWLRRRSNTTSVEMKGWTIDVQKLVVDVPPKIDVEDDAPRQVVEKSPEPYSPSLPPETPIHVVQQVGGGPGAGFPETADFYPSLSIHLGEEGISTVRVCVDAKGRLTSEPTTVKGSGNARLDEGALKLARAGSGHYRATTEDGQPVNSCYAFGVRFQLKK